MKKPIVCLVFLIICILAGSLHAQESWKNFTTDDSLPNNEIRAIFEMAGAICHEFNQPLQIIKGNAELITMKVSNDSALLQQVQDIKEATDRLGNLTRKVMSMTRYKTKDYIGGTKIIDIENATSENENI